MPGKIVGRSPALRKLRSLLPHLGSLPTPIVLVGEAGVGKSFLAAHIHNHSPLRKLPVEAINFSLLSERDQRIALLGGGPPELTTTRRSLLEASSTVLIKHIDLAGPFLQERLVEILASKKISRLGLSRNEVVWGPHETYPLASRVIFTLHHSPHHLLRRGRIILSLFEILQRLRIISVPPLRKRREDIPLLAEHFLHQFYDGLHSLVDGEIPHVQGLTERGKIDPSLARILIGQLWEGNVLQLKSFIHSFITPSHLDAIQQSEKIEVSKMLLMLEEGSEFSLRHSMSVIEKGLIGRALEKYDGNQLKAAQMLGLTDRSVRRKKA